MAYGAWIRCDHIHHAVQCIACIDYFDQCGAHSRYRADREAEPSMTRRELWKRVGMGAILIAIPVIAFAPPLVYFGKEIRGKVVDADTGAPLEGVSIVAEWQIYVTVIQPHFGERLKVIETETNSTGEYRLPEWGPVVRPLWGSLQERSPMLTFFKSNYYPKVIMNANASNHMIRDSDFDGENIPIERFDGDFLRLDRALENSDAWLTGCWRACPRYVLALDAEAKRLRTIVPRAIQFSFPHELERMSKSDYDYFSSYKK
jgi:hypothetical protein